MKNFVTIVEFERYDCVTFYTILYEDEEITESDKFFDTFLENEKYAQDLEEIVARMDEMGERGARAQYFRFEGAAHAIPKNQKGRREVEARAVTGNRLRLYCLRVCDEIVILGNGGVKRGRTAQDDPITKKYFDQINRFAKAFDEKIIDREIRFKFDKEREIVGLEGDLELEI